MPYYTAYPGECQVKTSAVQVAGSSTFGTGFQAGLNFAITQWNTLYPHYAVPVPPWCAPPPPPPSPLPGGGSPPPPPTQPTPPAEGEDIPPSAPPPGPVTGPPPEEEEPPPPPEPAPDPCAPLTGIALDGDRAEELLADMAMPNVLGETGISVLGPGRLAVVAHPAVLEADLPAGVWSKYHFGTGAGKKVYHPGAMLDTQLHGEGYHPDSLWPAQVPEAGVHFLVSDDRASAGDDAITRLIFGRLLPDTWRPGRGLYTAMDPATGVMDLRHTGDDGTDSARRLRVDGNEVAYLSDIGGGGSVLVNGEAVSDPDFNDSTPAAGSGYRNVEFRVDGSSVSAQLDISDLGGSGGGLAFDLTTYTIAGDGPFELSAGDVEGRTRIASPNEYTAQLLSVHPDVQEVFYLLNVGPNSVTIFHNAGEDDGRDAAYWPILAPGVDPSESGGDANYVLGPWQGVTFVRDNTSSVWRLVP